jgi:hypothetical protein
MNRRAWSVWPLALCSLLASAQTPVYESKEKGTKVYSDQPAPGATRVELPPPNVVELPKPPPPPAPKASAAAPPPYRQLVIVSPENEGTVRSNTGAFEMQVQVRPDLRFRDGDRIRVRLDGRLLASSYSSPTISITSADWAGAAAAETVEHRLQVVVVNRGGTALIESAPVRFFVQRATRGG